MSFKEWIGKRKSNALHQNRSNYDKYPPIELVVGWVSIVVGIASLWVWLIVK